MLSWVLRLLLLCAALAIEIETFVDNDLIMVKISTIHGLSRSMELTMDGRVSTCDIATKDAAFMDVAGMLLRPLMNYDPARKCELDLKFMFSRYRHVILSHNSMVFTDEPLEGGTQCMLDSTTSGLCETRSGIVTLRWFSDSDYFYENAFEVDAMGMSLPPAAWSVRTPQPVVDVSEAHIVANMDIHYDIVSHRLDVRPRIPSLAMKIIAAVFGAIVAFIFVTRLMLDTTWKHLAVHLTMLAMALIATVVALLTRANNLRSPVFTTFTVVTLVIHIAVETVRLRVKRKRRQKHLLLWINLQPDMAIIMVAVILCFYAITSHSLIVIPTLLVMLYAVKTLSEVITVDQLPVTDTSSDPSHAWNRSVGILRTGVILTYVCIANDLMYTVVLWRFIVGDFLHMTLVAEWYQQELLLGVIVVDGALYVANLRTHRTKRPVSTADVE